MIFYIISLAELKLEANFVRIHYTNLTLIDEQIMKK